MADSKTSKTSRSAVPGAFAALGIACLVVGFAAPALWIASAVFLVAGGLMGSRVAAAVLVAFAACFAAFFARAFMA